MTWAQVSPALDDVIYRLGWTLLHSVWQGAVLAAAVWIVLRLLGVARPRARYAVSLAAMLAMTLAAIATGMLVRSPQRTLPDLGVSDQTLLPAEMHGVDLHLMPIPQPLPTQPFWTEQRIMPWLVAGWGAGVLMLSLWQVGGWMMLRNHRRNSLPVDPIWQERVNCLGGIMKIASRVGLAMTNRLDVPIVIGVIKPMILIPVSMLSELSPTQVEAILAHELAHVRRYDYLINLIQCAIETVFFYHPAVWWISKQIRREREFCCDELAAGACGDRTGYARALAALEESRMSLRLVPAAIRSRGELLVRVQRLLDPPASTRRERSRSGLVAILLLMTCLTLPLMSHRSSAQSSPPPTAPAMMPVDPLRATPSAITPADLLSPSEDYRISANDMVQVSINGLVQQGVETQVARRMRISNTGMISLPMIGQIQVAGLTEQGLAHAIAAKYLENKVALNEGSVSVQVVEARGQTFTITGDVDAIGQYAMVDPNFRALDALALARTTPAGRTIRILRKTDDPTRPRVIEVAGDRLLAGDMTQNIVIHPGDLLIVTKITAPATRSAAAGDDQSANGPPAGTQRGSGDARQPRPESPDALLLRQRINTYAANISDAKRNLEMAEIRYGSQHPLARQAQQELTTLERLSADAQMQLKMLEEPKPLTPLKSYDIVIKPGQILRDGKPTDWAAIRKEIEAIPAVERKNLFIALSAGSTTLQVKEYFQAQAEASKLVKDLGLAYLSDTGMAPNAEDVPVPVGESYIGGAVPRTGVPLPTTRAGN